MTYLNCRSVTMLFLRRFGSRKFFCLQIVKRCEGVNCFSTKQSFPGQILPSHNSTKNQHFQTNKIDCFLIQTKIKKINEKRTLVLINFNRNLPKINPFCGSGYFLYNNDTFSLTQGDFFFESYQNKRISSRKLLSKLEKTIEHFFC